MQRKTSQSGGPTLTPQQARVLESLVGGATVTGAAELAGIDRSTIHRWLRSDFGFQAAYNALRRDLQREVQARLDHLVELALVSVSQAVEAGDVRACLAVLRGTGVLAGTPSPIGPEDPAEIEDDASAAAKERGVARTLRRFGAL